MAIYPNDYYNRFQDFLNKKYKRSLFRAGKGLQSAELNEMHDYLRNEIRNIGETIFSNGGILSGGNGHS